MAVEIRMEGKQKCEEWSASTQSRHKDTTITTKIIFLISIIIFHREDIRHYHEEELSLSI